MKKILVLVLGLAVATAGTAFADHGNGLSLGVVGGSWFGANGFQGGDIGLALHVPSMPIYWGIKININDTVFGLGVTGDKYIYDQGLVSEGSFNLDWFLGIGGYANIVFADQAYAALGVRVPIGLSWHIGQPIELWVDLAPSLGLAINPVHFPDWGIVGEIGLRFWF